MADIDYTPALGVASTLVQSTGDVMDNIFDVLITFPWETSNSASAEVSYRCKAFNIPKPEKTTYAINWHGITAQKVASGIKMDRKLDLEFRLDATWSLYNKFISWSKITGDVNTGGTANTASALGTIKLVVPGSEFNAEQSWNTPGTAGPDDLLLNGSKGMKNTSMLYWNFSDVQCVNVDTPKFANNAEGKNQYYKVSFIFGDISYPGYTDPNS